MSLTLTRTLHHYDHIGLVTPCLRSPAGIERFYDCDDDMHRCLAEMYVSDERFTG